MGYTCKIYNSGIFLGKAVPNFDRPSIKSRCFTIPPIPSAETSSQPIPIPFRRSIAEVLQRMTELKQ